jgi:hypothetical protein
VSNPLASAGVSEMAPAAWSFSPIDPLASRLSEGLGRASGYAPGHGKLDLFGFAEPWRYGGGADYAHRLTPGWSAFAQGWAGAQRDASRGWHPGYGALGGLRFEW